MFTLFLIMVMLGLGIGLLYGYVYRDTSRDSTAWRGVAQASLVAGILSTVLTALVAILSFTPVLDAMPLRDPLGVAAFLGLPVALLGIVCGAVGLRSSIRSQALAGLLLSAACVVAWTLMQAIAG